MLLTADVAAEDSAPSEKRRRGGRFGGVASRKKGRGGFQVNWINVLWC